MNIIHFASHAINIGDGAIHYGTRDYFNKVLGTNTFMNVDVVSLDLAKSLLRPEEVDEVNSDLLLVGGGGSIDGLANKPCSISFPMLLSDLEKIKTRMCFWALGVNLFRNQEWDEGAVDRLNQLVDMCTEREWPFTVRADGSLARLEGVLTDNNLSYVHELPDPGFFIKTDRDFVVPTQSPYVLIQLASDNYGHRLSFEQSDIDGFFQDMAAYTTWLTKKELRVVFATHIQPDLFCVAEIFNQIDKNTLRLGTAVTGTYDVVNADKFFRYYEEAELAVGMRGHSVICGAGLGTPVLAIDTHDKVGGFMKEIGKAQYAINPLAPNFGDAIATISNDILFNGNYETDTIEARRAEWDADLVTFIEKYK